MRQVEEGAAGRAADSQHADPDRADAVGQVKGTPEGLPVRSRQARPARFAQLVSGFELERGPRVVPVPVRGGSPAQFETSVRAPLDAEQPVAWRVEPGIWRGVELADRLVVPSHRL